jgi:cysteine synthase
MRKTILTAVGAALIAVAATQVASANERHHVRKVEQFRKANNAIVATQPSNPEAYSYGWSAPAGR